jgi:hypothetical protein
MTAFLEPHFYADNAAHQHEQVPVPVALPNDYLSARELRDIKKFTLPQISGIRKLCHGQPD